MRAVAIRCDAPKARRYIRTVRADAHGLLKQLSLCHHELSLVLADDSQIRELNRVFRGRDHCTDVLSFPLLDEWEPATSEPAGSDYKSGPAPIGDVVISVDTAVRQARRLGITPDLRLRTLLIHGMLHLLGFDHEKSQADARRMFARERELAASLASSEKTYNRRLSATALREAESP